MRSPLLRPSLLLALAVTVAACSSPDGEDTEAAASTDADDRATPVEVLVADPGLFEDVIELTGTVASPNDANLSPDVPGTLTYVAPVGTFVRQGATVAQVKASGQQAGVAQARAQVRTAQASIGQAEAGVRAARAQREAAQAQLDLAQDQYRRQFPLYRDSILSAIEFRGVESQLASARAQVAQADAGIAQAQGQLQAAQGQLGAAQAGLDAALTQLSNTRVVAPFSGVVEERMMEPGELASPGMPVVRLVAGGTVKIEAGVPERYAGEIEVGTTVQVAPSAYGAEPRGGRVTFSGLAVNVQSRTFPIEVAVDNSDGALKPAMVVRLAVTRDVLDGVIAVPTEAVVRDERGTSVFIAAADTAGTIATRRIVELGPNAGATVVVSSGLEAGDRVIVSGAGSLAEGDRVRITETREVAQTSARPDRQREGAAVRPTSAESRSE